MAVKVVAFDVNETLPDLSDLDGPFEEVLGDRSLRGQWFAQMLQLSFVGGLTGEYVDFTSAQRAAFLMIARRVGVPVSEHDAEAMVDRMSALSPHPEVRPALQKSQRHLLKGRGADELGEDRCGGAVAVCGTAGLVRRRPLGRHSP